MERLVLDNWPCFDAHILPFLTESDCLSVDVCSRVFRRQFESSVWRPRYCAVYPNDLPNRLSYRFRWLSLGGELPPAPDILCLDEARARLRKLLLEPGLDAGDRHCVLQAEPGCSKSVLLKSTLDRLPANRVLSTYDAYELFLVRPTGGNALLPLSGQCVARAHAEYAKSGLCTFVLLDELGDTPKGLHPWLLSDDSKQDREDDLEFFRSLSRHRRCGCIAVVSLLSVDYTRLVPNLAEEVLREHHWINIGRAERFDPATLARHFFSNTMPATLSPDALSFPPGTTFGDLEVARKEFCMMQVRRFCERYGGPQHVPSLQLCEIEKELPKEDFLSVLSSMRGTVSADQPPGYRLASPPGVKRYEY